MTRVVTIDLDKLPERLANELILYDRQAYTLDPATIPNDVWRLVTSHLEDVSDYVNLCQTCKHFYRRSDISPKHLNYPVTIRTLAEVAHAEYATRVISERYHLPLAVEWKCNADINIRRNQRHKRELYNHVFPKTRKLVTNQTSQFLRVLGGGGDQWQQLESVVIKKLVNLSKSFHDFYCPQIPMSLTSLTLNKTRTWTPGHRHILTHVIDPDKLTNLCIENEFELTDESLNYFSAFTNLTTLSLSKIITAHFWEDLALLPNLTKLQALNCTWYKPNETDLAATVNVFETGFKKLTKLTLGRFDHFLELLELASILSALRDLTIEYFYEPDERDEKLTLTNLIPRAQPYASLEHLSLCNSSFLLQKMRVFARISPLSAPCLRSLEINGLVSSMSKWEVPLHELENIQFLRLQNCLSLRKIQGAFGSLLKFESVVCPLLCDLSFLHRSFHLQTTRVVSHKCLRDHTFIWPENTITK